MQNDDNKLTLSHIFLTNGLRADQHGFCNYYKKNEFL